MDSLQSLQLEYRPFMQNDSDQLFLLDSDPLVHRYLGNNPIKTVDDAKAVIHLLQKQYEQYGIGRYATFEKLSGDFIGWTGVKFIVDEEAGLVNFHDIGYRLRPEYWNKGYATEATQFWLKYSFEIRKVEEVYGSVNIENKASRRVLEKCGLTYFDSFDWHGIPCDRLWITLKDYDL